MAPSDENTLARFQLAVKLHGSASQCKVRSSGFLQNEKFLFLPATLPRIRWYRRMGRLFEVNYDVGVGFEQGR